MNTRIRIGGLFLGLAMLQAAMSACTDNQPTLNDTTVAAPVDQPIYAWDVLAASILVGPAEPPLVLEEEVAVDIYYPVAPGSSPAPVMVLFHGICGTQQDMAGYAELLASRGYIAVNMETRVVNGCEPGYHVKTDAHNVLKLVSRFGLSQIEASFKATAAPMPDRSRLGIGGFSRGGWAAALAAINPHVDDSPEYGGSESISLGALLLLEPKADTTAQQGPLTTAPVMDLADQVLDLPPGDPPDGGLSSSRDAVAMAESIQIPTAVFGAEVEVGNLVWNDSARLFERLIASKTGMKVIGASHGDIRTPPEGSPEFYSVYLRYASAFLDYYLMGRSAKPGAQGFVDVDGAQRTADAAAGIIEIGPPWDQTTDLPGP